MRVMLPLTSLASLLLISVGVGLEYGYTYGLITAGAMLWFEANLAALAILRSARRAQQ